MKIASVATSTGMLMSSKPDSAINASVLMEALRWLLTPFDGRAATRMSRAASTQRRATVAARTSDREAVMRDAFDADGRGRQAQVDAQRATMVLDGLPDSIVVSANGILVQANAAALRLTGVDDPSELRGRHVEDVFPGIALPGEPIACGSREATVRTGCKAAVPVELTIRSLPDCAVPSFVIIAKPLADEPPAAYTMLARHAVEFAKVGHEFRTPLNAVLGFGQLLQMQAGLGESQRKAVDGIVLGGRHLLRLVNDFVEIARSDAGQLEIDAGPVQLGECLKATVDMLRGVAGPSGPALALHMCEDVPTTVMADLMRLRQVLLNLLGNAMKFTPHGEVSLSVRSVARRGADVRLAFEVRDTGVGMTPQELDSIFRPFAQVGDARRRSEGSGLGLVISREIVRRMGGDIVVKSQPGQGTCFSFELDVPVID